MKISDNVEEALQESEERFWRLAESAQGLLIYRYRLTPTPGFEYVSPAATAITGYSPEEHYADPSLRFKLVHPEDRPLLEAIKQSPASRGDSVVLRWVRKDGSVIWIEQRDVPICDEAGKPVAIEGVARDVTEHKRVEEALRRRNRELELLYQAGQALNSTLDLDQVLATVLEETRRLLGVVACSVWLIEPRSSLQGSDAEGGGLVCRLATGPQSEIVRGWRLAPAEGIASWVAGSGESLIVPDAYADERHFKGVDELTKLALRSILSVPLRVKTGVIGVLQVVDTEVDRFGSTDLRLIESLAASAASAIENARLHEQAQQEIAERVRAEQALQASESRYRALFDDASDAIFIHDLEGRFLEVNRVACERLGYSREELLQMSMMTVDSPEYAALMPERIKKLYQSDQVLFETAHVRRDGGTIPIELSSRIIEYNGMPAVLSIARDITERKRMEQYLLRTERLAAMGHLAAAMAHEINNPLQSIGSSIELVLDFPLEERERQGYMEAVRREIERLMTITGRVLDFARPPRIEHQPVSVTEVVRYALTLADKRLQHGHIQVSLDLPDILAHVLGSRDRLAQVFLNLIINAIEAMPDGGKLSIAVRPAGEQVEVTFIDSGPGISPGVLTTVFEPFHTTKKDGTGLGLAISYSIIQGHGGTITAGNAPDGGAVFSIALPLASPNGYEGEEKNG